MDNLCHTLAGLAIGEAGLKRRTALATATLVIGANLPDIDGLSYFWSAVTALGFRRGWTHGVLALVLWPFILAGLMLAWDRLVRLRRNPDAPAARPRALLLVATVAILSHPFLDWMNVYGMRWLMPFSDRWFYGDTLFIIDPWIWLALLGGIIGSRVIASRTGTADGAAGGERWARGALALVSIYIGVMAAFNAIGRGTVRSELAARGVTAEALMVGPVPASPLRREAVFQTGTTYGLGSLSSPLDFAMGGDAIQRHPGLAIADSAARTPAGRTFLRWARFPVYVVGPYEGCPAGHVCLRDARYYNQSWAEVAIPVTGPVSFAPVRTQGEGP